MQIPTGTDAKHPSQPYISYFIYRPRESERKKFTSVESKLRASRFRILQSSEDFTNSSSWPFGKKTQHPNQWRLRVPFPDSGKGWRAKFTLVGFERKAQRLRTKSARHSIESFNWRQSATLTYLSRNISTSATEPPLLSSSSLQNDWNCNIFNANNGKIINNNANNNSKNKNIFIPFRL